MLLSRFFAKNYRTCMEKGDRHFAEERYADARHAFLEALEKVDGTVDESGEITGLLNQKLSETGNRLGLLNLSEAEYAMSRGDAAKAEEHLGLVLEFAEDPALREKAERLLMPVAAPDPGTESPQPQHDCSRCVSGAGEASDHPVHAPDHMSDEERFELLVQTLPADLTERYTALGQPFARAYLLIHDGEDQAGAAILKDLLCVRENDIILYELALIDFRAGNTADCEALLMRAMTVNDSNPLCCLGMVQLLAETGRLAECIPLLNSMIERSLLTEQAVVFLGDVHLRLGNEEEAMGRYAQAILHPGAAKAAAERLVPLLQKQGRGQEAAYLAKNYLKGCC